MSQESSPLLVVLSGPSGVGKDAALERLKARGHTWHFTVTATTRQPRPSEVDGIDYLFVSESNFNAMIANGELMEHAEVYGCMYGVPRRQVREALARGQDVFLKVDVQGAATIKALAPEAVFIFLAAGSADELRSRLEERRSEIGPNLDTRTEAAQEEMRTLPMFDYCVVNRDQGLDEAVAQIEAIVTAEHCRIPPRRVSP